MKKTFLVTALVLVLTITAMAENICRVGDFERHRDNRVSLGIYLANTDTIAGFQIPMSFDIRGFDLTCDSIIFEGGRCTNFDLINGQFDNDAKELCIFGASRAEVGSTKDYLNAGRGEIARIYFTYERPSTLVFANERDSLRTRFELFRSEWKLEGGKLKYAFWNPKAIEVGCRFKVDKIEIYRKR